jgi:lysophospholipase L1-like esterase
MTTGAALDPAPFLRGNPFPPAGGVAFPRADPGDRARLPIGTWAAASAAIGVRLELVGDATSLAVGYHAGEPDVPTRAAVTGTEFEVWSGDRYLGAVAAAAGDHVVELPLASGTTTIYVPDRLNPSIRSIRPVGGSVAPAPAAPRWIAYGDSIVEGWSATRAGRCWAAIVARSLGLDLHNLGYAGTARGEIASAEQIGRLPADVVSLGYGTNCWSTVPHSAAMVAANLHAFVTLVRAGHPQAPLVVSTPIVRPAAEEVPNALGATLGDLRQAMHATLDELRRADGRLVVVDGRDLVGAGALVDGIHPGDEGHAVMAERMAPAFRRALGVRTAR